MLRKSVFFTCEAAVLFEATGIQCSINRRKAPIRFRGILPLLSLSCCQLVELISPQSRARWPINFKVGVCNTLEGSGSFPASLSLKHLILSFLEAGACSFQLFILFLLSLIIEILSFNFSFVSGLLCYKFILQSW